jgi:hypothetical protein
VITLADIILQHISDLIADGSTVLPSQKKALRQIAECRTSVLGGQKWQCGTCHQEHYSFHSCRNRHCPRCQHDRAEEWLLKQPALLLPVPYFLVTVTVPKQLRIACYSHQRQLYHILFQAAAKALLTLAHEKRHLGAEIGMLGVLHTWRRDLNYHPHIHFLISGGGVVDGTRWKYAKADFLVPHKPLSLLIRRLFRDVLKQTGLYNIVDTKVWRTDWVVNIKPVGDGRAALKYLAPYIMRVALSNKNILSLKEGIVTWRYKDSNSKIWKTRSLPAGEFLRLFLRHVLPKGFVKVRYFGYLATKKRGALEVIKEPVGIRLTVTDSDKPKENLMRCSACGGKLVFVAELPRRRGPPFEEVTIWLSL